VGEAWKPSNYTMLLRTPDSTEHIRGHIIYRYYFLVFKAMPWIETVSRWPLIADVFQTEMFLSVDSANK
jgi:hypothetical protein